MMKNGLRLLVVMGLCLIASGMSLAQGVVTRVRFIDYVSTIPNVDATIDGKIVQQNMGADQVTDYYPIEPGVHHLEFLPTGGASQTPVVKLFDQEFLSGHDYVVAIIGQADDSSIKPLVIDETETLNGMQATANQTLLIVLNDIKGAPALDLLMRGQTVVKSLAYGQYKALTLPVGPFDDMRLVASDDPTQVIEDLGDSGFGFWDPYVFYLLAFQGKYPGAAGTDYGPDYEPLVTVNMVDWLAAETATKTLRTSGTVFSYATFLKALDIAGLTDILKGDEPYTVIAPTDAAFAALPPATLNKLMADPKSLARALGDYILKGKINLFNYPRNQPLLFPNLNGTETTIVVSDDYSATLNGHVAMEPIYHSASVVNGMQYAANGFYVPSS